MAREYFLDSYEAEDGWCVTYRPGSLEDEYTTLLIPLECAENPAPLLSDLVEAWTVAHSGPVNPAPLLSDLVA